MERAKRSAPHVSRNTAPILEVLRQALPENGLVLEVASGSGEQSVAFARSFPKLLWQPTDPDKAALGSIAAWRESERPFNLLPPLALDAQEPGWPIASAEAIVCINMVHISPWEATQGLMRGAGRLLGTGGALFLYVPYRREGGPTATSNEAFDQSLKARDHRWGLRTVEAVTDEAGRNGLSVDRLVEMAANNLSLVFRRQ